jgi:NADPH:quinone reductase-like Zn-dependent oxidoreductase
VVEKAAVCRAVADYVWPMIESGMIKPPPQTRFPLGEVAAAHAHLESGNNIGKIILTVT